jgi:molecular chaperone DnaK
VALGAGVLASRLAGHEVERVLVDVSPYSFGVSYLGERGGVPYPHCYKPIIRRNSPLPLTRTERFYTSVPFQEVVNVCVYEGEDEDALKNIPVGNFKVKDLKKLSDPSEVLCRMSLDLDGILHVTAIEKCTGKSKHVTVDRALEKKSDAEIAAARKRLEALYSSRIFEDTELDADAWLEEEREELDEDVGVDGSSHTIIPTNGEWAEVVRGAEELVARSRRLVEQMHEEDRAEAIDLNRKIETAIPAKDEEALQGATKQLAELLFFVEGKQ